MTRHEAKQECIRLRNQLTGDNGVYRLRDARIRAVALARFDALMAEHVIHPCQIEERPVLMAGI